MAGSDYDVLVVGSGFGGSVAALRLTEKGYRVGVVEAGRRFADDELPETSWDVRSYLWAPALGCHGIQRISLLRDVVILAGAGVGGGSLVYGNTLYRPSQAFYDDVQWAKLTDWRSELEPHFELAERMLGAVSNPTTTLADQVLREVAVEMGFGDTYQPTPVGVFFGQPGVEVADPYFGGMGPARRGCIECGACMTGCRHNAKNTLVKNYLYLAERAGAEILPMTTAIAVRPVVGGGYVVETKPTALAGRRTARNLSARHVVFAAGTLGTQRLLHRMRYQRLLPGLSERLGVLTRTNSEAIVGARSRRSDVDFTRGVAITSSVHPDGHTHIEPVRYGSGSDLMGLLQTALTDPVEGRSRLALGLRQSWLQRADVRTMYGVRGWARQTVIALVMQSLDNSMTVYPKPAGLGRVRLSTRPGHGEPSPTWVPVGHDVARRIAEKIDGVAGGAWGDLFNTPMTAHFIGGAVIGDSTRSGVIDAYHRVYGHPGLHVVDGSAISANLGVNPSLTITAQAERAMSYWPNRGEADPRPTLGEGYRRIDPVPPRDPAVPSHAPAAMRPGSSKG
ncbi:MAG: GMC family oxidoreductase N-terminal domain-containing protein [Acidimicrobiales bacterium]